ncbi:MAG: FAD-dependent oxidoreductase [Eubacteriales bacterium]|nr:FAD-dependent oxidoreductase [Eubacteriales bacterium]
MYDMIVIGAGTAGLSAAIYGVRAGKTVLVLEAKSYGGQIINTPEVENYPGIRSISGFEFATGLYEQAKALGAQVKYERVLRIEDRGVEKTVVTGKDAYPCKCVIVATGAKNRPLGVEREQEMTGKGISYCATCDGMFFRGKDVAVVGGGSTALEDAAFLANYCGTVYVIHRRDAFRGEDRLVRALEKKENVTYVMDSQVVALNGEETLRSVTVENKKTKERTELPVSGLFIAIGQMPDNGAFAELVELDPAGYVRAGEDCRTSAQGIFTAGDCRTKAVRQLTTAAADGAVAALAACVYIDGLD